MYNIHQSKILQREYYITLYIKTVKLVGKFTSIANVVVIGSGILVKLRWTEKSLF